MEINRRREEKRREEEEKFASYQNLYDKSFESYHKKSNLRNI